MPPVTNDLVEAPGIGHNQPPLGEQLLEETADLKQRADDLVAAARRAIVSDEDTAKRATLLVGMMVAHLKLIDEARKERDQPFLDSVRAINQHFANIRLELAGPDLQVRGGETARVQALVDAYYAEEERRAEAERRRLEEEARRIEEAAAAAEQERLAAEQKSRLAALAGDVQGALDQSEARINAELRERHLAEEARRVMLQAKQTVVAPLDTGLGVKAHRKTNYKAQITDWTLAMRHALKTNEQAFRDLVQSIYDRQVRAGARALPGANIIEDRTTFIRNTNSRRA